jgi:hypothetical protein
MKQNKRLTSRRIGAAAVLAAVTTTCGGLALAPAAFADSTVASTTTYSTVHSAAHSTEARPETANECYAVLNGFGYTVTVPRGTACFVAASHLPTTEAAIAACIAGLVATGVSALVVAPAACAAGATPG